MLQLLLFDLLPQLFSLRANFRLYLLLDLFALCMHLLELNLILLVLELGAQIFDLPLLLCKLLMLLIPGCTWGKGKQEAR